MPRLTYTIDVDSPAKQTTFQENMMTRNQGSFQLERLHTWRLNPDYEDTQPPLVYFLGIQTSKHLAIILPKMAYADRTSFTSDISSLGPLTVTIEKSSAKIKIYYEAFLYTHELKYSTNIQTDRLLTISLTDLDAKNYNHNNIIFTKMVEAVQQFRQRRTVVNRITHVIAFVANAEHPQNDIIAEPHQIHIKELKKVERKFFFEFILANVPSQNTHSDNQVWQSKMCVMKKVSMPYTMPIDLPNLQPGRVTTLPTEPDQKEKLLSIESFFNSATDAAWRQFVREDTRQALYFELLYNPETVLTYTFNYFYHKYLYKNMEQFDKMFAAYKEGGWVFTNPLCSEWLLTCIDFPGSGLLGSQDTDFGWTPRIDEVSNKFNVSNRVAFDNTAAWPDNCTNHAIAPDAQGQNWGTDMHTLYVLSTESHQLDAFLGRPTYDKKTNEWIPNKHVPACSLTQACCNFVDKFYGCVFTNHGSVPQSKDQLGKFFNRGTDFSVLTKSRELLHVKVPVLLNVPEDGRIESTTFYSYVMVRVKLDGVLGRTAYIADNVHNKALSASYMTSLCKAAAELYPAPTHKETLNHLFGKCYCFCQSLTKQIVPISYGYPMDQLIRLKEPCDILVELGQLQLQLPLDTEIPVVDPGRKPNAMGPPRQFEHREPVGYDMYAYHGPTSQVYSTYNANLVSDKIKHPPTKRGGGGGGSSGGSGGTGGGGNTSSSSSTERPPSLCTLLFSQAHIYYWCRNPTGNDAKVLGTKSLMTVVHTQPDKPTLANVFMAEFVRPNGVIDKLCAYAHTYFSTRTLNHKVGILPNLDPPAVSDDMMYIAFKADEAAVCRFNQILYNKTSVSPPVVYFAQFSTSNNHANYSPSRALRTKKKEESLTRPKSTHTNSPTTFFCFMNVDRKGYMSLSKLHNGHEHEVYQSLYGIKNLTKKYTKPDKDFIALELSTKKVNTLDDLTGSEKLLKNVIWSMYVIVDQFRQHVINSKLFTNVTLFSNNKHKANAGEEIRIHNLENTLTSLSVGYGQLKTEHAKLQGEHLKLKLEYEQIILQSHQ